MIEQIGTGSLRFKEAPFLVESASIVGTKEGEGPLGSMFDVVGEDDKFGQNTWEKAESCLQQDALTLAIGKAGVKKDEIRYLFAGDLLGQSMASSFGLKQFEIPLFGVYGACSTCGESLSLASIAVASGSADCVAAVTSSHFASAEKQFRFPLEYANQRPVSATWTVTGSGAFILGNESYKGKIKHQKAEKYIRITGITTGKIVDYGIKDSMNMGAAMAPAAADLIRQNLNDYNVKADEYDKIITGDLGSVGRQILCDLLSKDGIKIEDIHEDCGMMIFDADTQKTGSGGSGCGCSATTLSAYYLPKIRSGELRKILFIPTGALLSPVSFNEGESVPGIAHGIIIEGE